MKHTVIAIICFIAVVVYSAFTYIFISDFTDSVEDKLSVLNSYSISADSVNEVKQIYEDKKGVLYYILNKEHLENIESYIIQLEQAVNYDNLQDTETYKELLHSAIMDITHQNRCII
ncbi:MAG: hypothetical protein IJ339_04775 [Oscillospiraceae bacterium]|nr:hypothetical protein [Oscillospiraceae bacterium]MBQ7816651.1 hypothetical protein [Oscillospiraceae bacterium]